MCDLKVNDIFDLAVKCVDIKEISKGHGSLLRLADAEWRKCGYRLGFETPVVHTLNDEYEMF